MAWVAVATVGGALIGANASKGAAKAQAGAADRATELQQEQYDAAVARNKPFYEGGLKAYDALLTRLGLSGDPTAAGYGSLTGRLTPEQVMAEPGYQFGLSEGQKAIDRQMGANGMRYSGAAIKAAGRYANDYATGQFNNAFGRLRNMQADEYGRIMDIAGVGQASANNTTAAGTRYADMAGQNAWGAANARAANSIAQGNVWTNALNQGVSAYNNYNNNRNPITSPNVFGNYGNVYNDGAAIGGYLPDSLRGGGGW